MCSSKGKVHSPSLSFSLLLTPLTIFYWKSPLVALSLLHSSPSPPLPSLSLSFFLSSSLQCICLPLLAILPSSRMEPPLSNPSPSLPSSLLLLVPSIKNVPSLFRSSLSQSGPTKKLLSIWIEETDYPISTPFLFSFFCFFVASFYFTFLSFFYNPQHSFSNNITFYFPFIRSSSDLLVNCH